MTAVKTGNWGPGMRGGSQKGGNGEQYPLWTE